MCLAFWAEGRPRGAEPTEPPGDVSFTHDVRPILADKCFACHGPDAAAREADLRLDMPASALAGHEHGVPIVPGDPDASELVRRISSRDPDVVMPPPESKLTLGPHEMAILRRWIEQGAAYERHWAFERLPAGVEAPEVRDGSWPSDPLDRFVLACLEREGLSPSAPASRERWLRRVSFDLTGLPPTLEEIDAFLADASDSAHGRVVDRLLASAHFGERMAVPWLDAARYADSYGYQSDLLSPTWPWRDWVVRAFNDDMPYDEFLVRQLAGDLLPGATRDDRLATAFNRLHRMTNEGGSIPEEWRTEYAADRVETLSSAVLGLTMQCARCHDHKYDPVSQREYYQLAAYFNSIDEHGLYERSDIVPTPSLLLPSSEQEVALDDLRREAARLEADMQRVLGEREPVFQEWLRAGATGVGIPELTGRFALDEIGPEGSLKNELGTGDGHAGAGASTAAPVQVAGRQGGAIRLDGDNLIHLPGVSDLDRWTPFTIAFWVRDTQPAPGERVVVHRSSGTDAGHYGFDLLIEGGRLTARAFRHWPGNAVAVRTVDPCVPAGGWTHVVLRYDGSSRAAGLGLFVDGEPAPVRVVRDRVWKTIGGGATYGPGGHDLILGQRFRDRGLAGGEFDGVRIVRRAVSDLEARALYDGATLDGSLAGPDEGVLREYFLSAVDPEARGARFGLEGARRALAQLEDQIAEIMVMEELAEPRVTHLLARGEYDAPKNEVPRGVPAVLDLDEAVPPRDRLELARWLVSDDHPLTARVAVNRFWQACFGRGLVESSDNFGAQGSAPTHPELLEFLAREFVNSGWDTKLLLRRIVLSSTYRQDSAMTPELLERDPENRLLARGPSRRLEAEMIRDAALAGAGLLVRDIGGAPVSPYQPEGLWQEFNAFSPPYQRSQGGALYRRSLYTVWKRTAPMPSMITFDSPGREACVARRTETSTPLQALVLLNDVQFVEAARVLAQRAMRAESEDAARVEIMFGRLTGRSPTDAESEILTGLLDEQRGIYQREPAEAARLLALGETPVDEALDPVEVAALTVVAQTILSLDATVWLR